MIHPTIKKIISILLCCTFSACGNSGLFPIESDITEDVLRGCATLNFEPLSFQVDSVGIKDFRVYKDSLLVVLRNAKNDQSFFEFYDFKKGNLISAAVKKGNGPGEMLGCNRIQIDNDKLLIFDFIKQQYATVDMENILESTTYPQFRKIPASVHFSSVSEYDDQTLLCLNPFCFKSKEMHIDNHRPRFLLIPKDGRLAHYPSSGSLYQTGNVAQGFLATNEKLNRIVFFSDSDGCAELYDYELNPLKIVTGPRKLDVKYIIKDDRQIVFYKRVPIAYSGVAVTDERIYASFVGDWYRHDSTKLNSFIIVFDWDGNFIRSYNCMKYIRSLSVSNDGKSVFATGFDEGEPILLRAEISN